MIATTATEAVLYDEIVGGQLRYWMGSLTAKNLPLSMFLETPDLGYPAWSGATNKNASNADIKSSLGLGIVRFEEQPEDPVITTYDYEYRVNTEVITAVDVSGGQSDPDNPARVTFTIDAGTIMWTMSIIRRGIPSWHGCAGRHRTLPRIWSSRSECPAPETHMDDQLQNRRPGPEPPSQSSGR